VKRLVRRAGRECWVEGDNAARSRDSRHFGPVDSSRIVGRLLMRYAPLPPRRPARWLTTRS
jgi:type IV secretory pathway protease TraF